MIETILILLGAVITVLGGVLKLKGSLGSREEYDGQEEALSQARQEVDEVIEADLEEIADERDKDVDKYNSDSQRLADDANDIIAGIRRGGR